ncbi:hypothetical protein IAT38_005290 [Cryptococcus sp. DSM 104549]
MLALLYALAAAGIASAAQFSNPVRDSGPDPFIVYDKDTMSYYLMTTTGKDLRLISSPTLGGLTNGTNTQVYTDDSMKSDATVWAGELHKVDGSWYIYYSHSEKVWAMKGGANPLDAYTGSPVQVYDGWGIDGTVLVVSGKNYFVWACHANEVSDIATPGSSVCISPLTTPTSVNKDSIAVLSSANADWEKVGGYVNEGPQPIYWDNEIYMTYSASFCTSDSYSLGLLHLTGDDPMKPASWTKKTDGPVFSSGNGEYGPGHNGIFVSPDGTELWNVYHAVTNPEGSCGMDRQTFAQKVDTSDFATKGPVFGNPVKKGEVLAGPSGEDGTATAESSSASDVASATSTAESTETSSAEQANADPTSDAASVTEPTATASATDANATASATRTGGGGGGHHHTRTADGVGAVVATDATSATDPVAIADPTTAAGEVVTVTSGEATSTTTLYVTASDVPPVLAAVESSAAAPAESSGSVGGLTCKAKRAKLAGRML